MTESDEHILALGDDDLVAIAAALRSGRLSLPITDVAVSRIVGAPSNPALGGALRSWAQGCVDASKLAWVIEMVAESRKRHARADDLIELVLTSPDVPGVPVRETAAVVHEMFTQAKQAVIVAGYAIHKGRRVFRALADRMRSVPGLKVRMFFDIQRRFESDVDSDGLIADFIERFKKTEWPDAEMLPEVYYYPPSIWAAPSDRRSCLHAKIVVIDRQLAFVSSANFTEAAHERNLEVGVLLRSPTHAIALSQFFESLTESGQLRRIV